MACVLLTLLRIKVIYEKWFICFFLDLFFSVSYQSHQPATVGSLRSQTSATAVIHSHVSTTSSSLELLKTHNNQGHLYLVVHHYHDFRPLILRNISLPPTSCAFPSTFYVYLYDVLLFTIFSLWESLLSSSNFNIIFPLANFFRNCAAHGTLGLKLSYLLFPWRREE